MKAVRFYGLVIAVCLLFIPVMADDAFAQVSVQQTMKRFNCAKDRSGTTFCQRIAPAGRYSGQEGVYTEKSTGKICKWKCRTEQGVETCQGNGPECTNRTPPHWR